MSEVETEKRLTIMANKNMSRGKFAAHAVHAALDFHGLTDHGAVIVVGGSASQIEEQSIVGHVFRDQGRTEVEPGTVTAGVLRYEETETPEEYRDLAGAATRELAAEQVVWDMQRSWEAMKRAEEKLRRFSVPEINAAMKKVKAEVEASE